MRVALAEAWYENPTHDAWAEQSFSQSASVFTVGRIRTGHNLHDERPHVTYFPDLPAANRGT